jgi:hypothetical protein
MAWRHQQDLTIPLGLEIERMLDADSTRPASCRLGVGDDLPLIGIVASRSRQSSRCS